MELAVKENKTATAAKKQGHFFGKKSGVPFFFPVFIQPKLTIGAVDDPYEREADAMAAKVMRIENKNSAQTFFKPAVASIQRKCAHCEEEERVQKKDAGGGATSSTAPALVREVVSSPGQPLEKNTAGFMESRFGYEFGNVRIHNDVQAHQSAASINALAYTHKNHVVFAKDQFQPFTNNGRQLLAHELTHTLQQQYTTPLIQRRKADEQSVKQCREDQKSGHILPQHIEEAERKKQDVLLDIVLKKDRKAFEKMIRDDIDALMFVCEEGVPAVLALYYNRDHNNSLFITKARKSYASFPDYYSSLGVAKSHRQKQILETTFGISIIRGNKDWSPRDLSLLQQALAKLTVNESSFIRGYQFIRWTTTCAHLKSDNPDHECELEDYQRCGFHIAEIADRSRNIWIYDCMDASPHSEYSVDPGADTILHEIGHAIERGQNMTTMERSADADKAYEIKKALLGKAAPTDKAALTAEVEKLKIAKDKANAEMYKVTSNNTLVRFSKLINRKKQLTEYSKVNDIEAFGDAFMLFKVNPKALEAGNKAMYDFFVNEKFGDFKTGAAGREMKLKESCTGDSARIGEWVTVKNQHDFAALDGYSPIKGKMHDVFYDGKNHFFCFNDKRVYFKYSENKSGVTPDLETAYNIKVINGGAEWLQPELAIVSEALSMLSPGEVADLRGYRFI